MSTATRERVHTVKYPFRDGQSGKVVYLRFPFGDERVPGIGKTLVHKGRTLVRLSCEEVASEPAMVPPGRCFRPKPSIAMGVPAFQVPAMREHFAKLGGYQPKFDPKTGNVITEGRGDRKRAMEAFGMFDRDAGYGDRAPR